MRSMAATPSRRTRRWAGRRRSRSRHAPRLQRPSAPERQTDARAAPPPAIPNPPRRQHEETRARVEAWQLVLPTLPRKRRRPALLQALPRRPSPTNPERPLRRENALTAARCACRTGPTRPARSLGEDLARDEAGVSTGGRPPRPLRFQYRPMRAATNRLLAMSRARGGQWSPTAQRRRDRSGRQRVSALPGPGRSRRRTGPRRTAWRVMYATWGGAARAAAFRTACCGETDRRRKIEALDGEG